MRIQLASSALLLLVGVAQSTPPYMWIGTTCVSDFNTTGGPNITHPNACTWADKFYQGAVFYSNYNGVTGQPTPTRNWNISNSGATFNAIRYGSAPTQSDFIFHALAGAGLDALNNKATMGHGSAYGNLPLSNYPLGSGYPRWVIFQDDNTLNQSTNTGVSPMFRGLQTGLGFRAVSNKGTWWTSTFVPESFSIFWRNWAYWQWSQWDSFKNALQWAASNAGVAANITQHSSQTSAGNAFLYRNYLQSTGELGLNNSYLQLTHSNF